MSLSGRKGRTRLCRYGGVKLAWHRWQRIWPVGVPGSRIHPAVPGYNITVTIVSYRIAKHSHVCFTPPDNNHPGCKNHRAELRMRREMHMISLSTYVCMCIYRDRDIWIYIATSTCTCMHREYAHAQEERGRIARLQ